MPALVALVLTMHLSLVVWAIVDIRKPDREVLGGNKRRWLLVVVFGNVIGPLAYLLFGRTFEHANKRL